MSIRSRLLIAVLLSAASHAALAQTYTIATFAGGGLPVNIPATSANFYRVESIALDKSGNMFFVDLDTVLRLDAGSGALTLAAGTGAAGFGADNVLASKSLLNQPHGITIDSSGNLFIADTVNNRIRKVTNGVITTIAGTGTAGFSGDNGPAVSAQLNGPAAIALDAAGNLYITDSNNYRIRKISSGVITTIAGNGTSSFVSDNGPATSVGFAQPQGLAVDSAGNIYVADTGNNLVREISNGTVTTIAGNHFDGPSGDGGPAVNAELSSPQAVVLDSTNNIYIADGNRVREISNGVINTVAGNGSCCFSGDNGPATSAELDGPEGIALDSAGNLYIADRAYIRKVSAGIINTLAGGGTQLSLSGGPTNARLNTPEGVAVDSAGNVYFADTSNNRVLKVSGGAVTLLAGTGVAGFSGDNGSATSAQLNGPVGIAVDQSGNVYIADTRNNRIRKIVNGVISTVAGNGAMSEGVGTFSGDGGTATSAGLNAPAGIALDASGNLYIADRLNNCIRMVSNGVISTVAGVGLFTTQQFTFPNFPNGHFGGDNGPATSALLDSPSAVALDPAGNLYIADTYNDRIRKVSAGIITTVAGNGTQGYTGNNGPSASAQISLPGGVAIDAASNLYFTDTSNGYIRKISNGIITTVAGNGTGVTLVGDIGDGGPALSAALVVPEEIAVASSGNIYVADSANNRIRVLTPPGAPTINSGGIVSVYSPVSAIEAGSWASIYGINLAGNTTVWNGDFPQSLGGVSVNIDNKPAYLWFVSPTQINLQVPDDGMTGTVSVAVTTSSGTATSTVTLASAAPSFSLLGDGKHVAGEIATQNGTGAYGGGTYDLVGPANTFSYSTRPVNAGETLTLYGVGFGPTAPHVPAGQLFSGSAPTSSAVTVTIGGVNANVIYSGITEAGLYQINLIVPANAGGGDQPLQASVNGVLTSNGPVVTLH